MAYRVTAPYVTVDVVSAPGAAPTALGFYKRAVLPPNTTQESARRLVAKGMAEEEVDTPAEESEPQDPARPNKGASKVDWLAYAAGVRPDDVAEDEALSRDQLAAKYAG